MIVDEDEDDDDVVVVVVNVAYSSLDIDDHLLVDVRIAYDFAELLEVDLSILVFVRKEDGLVHNLLELRVLQVATHHHFKHLEQLPVADVPVIIYVVDSEEKVEKKYIYELPQKDIRKILENHPQ